MAWLVVVLLVWLACAALAQRPRSERWRTRLYAVTLVPLSALGLVVVLFAVQLPTTDLSSGDAVASALADAVPYAQWLALAANLVVADIVRQRRSLSRRAGTGHGARHTTPHVDQRSTPAPASTRAKPPLPRTRPTREPARTGR